MSFFSKFTKGSRSRFSKGRQDTTGTGLPSQVPERVVPDRPAPAPAKEHDAKADVDKQLDETLVPEDKPVREKLAKPENKAHEGQSSTEPHTTSEAIGTESAYQIFWKPETNYRMIAEHHPERNSYVPSSIPLFKLLETAETRINVSKHIQQHEVDYLPYAVKVYYAYMYYFQILRAKREAGFITGFENSLLKRFEVKYPMSSLPCAQIVFPYFNTIIATELAEAKYDWIIPRIALDYPAAPTIGDPSLRGSNMHLFNATSGAAFLQPAVPHMMAMLITFIQHASTTLDNHIDGEEYTPVDLEPAANNASIFGVEIHNDDNNNQELKTFIRTAGINSPIVFGNQNYQTAANRARRTDIKDINVVVNTAVTRNPGSFTTIHNAKDLDTFLFMGKESDLRFFSFLRNQAVIHARFFDKVYHFSDVQTVGGLETTILAQLKRQGATPAYTDHHVGTPQQAAWFSDPFAKVISGFATNRAGVRRNEELQALAFGTHTLLPITGLPAPTTDASSSARGPFWDNHEWIQSLYFDQIGQALTRNGKPMYADFSSAMLRMYREKPHGTGVVDNDFD